MNPEYIAYPWRKDLEERDRRIVVLEVHIEDLTQLISTLERKMTDLLSNLEYKVNESSHKAHSAYRNSEEVRREVQYNIDSLRLKMGG